MFETACGLGARVALDGTLTAAPSGLSVVLETVLGGPIGDSSAGVGAFGLSVCAVIGLSVALDVVLGGPIGSFTCVLRG